MPLLFNNSFIEIGSVKISTIKNNNWSLQITIVLVRLYYYGMSPIKFKYDRKIIGRSVIFEEIIFCH